MLSSPPNSLAGSTSLLNNEDMLRLLTTSYFNPETASNPTLRQTLTYFIPVYCHSRKENMERMGSIALSVLQWCIGMKEELDVGDDEDVETEMVGLGIVIAHLSDWTDGRKLAAALNNLSDEDVKDADGGVHLDLAMEVMSKVLGVCSSKYGLFQLPPQITDISTEDERKLLISLLGKLYLSQNSDPLKLQAVYKLVEEAVESNIAADATTRNTLAKVRNTLWKATGTDQDLSRSRATSRAPSIAPSIADDDDDEKDGVTILDKDADDKSTMPPASASEPEDQAPTASPKKKARGKTQSSSSASPRKTTKTAKLTLEPKNPNSAESEQANPPPPTTKSRPIIAIMQQPPPAPQHRPRTKPSAAPVASSPEGSSLVPRLEENENEDDDDDDSTLRAADTPPLTHDSTLIKPEPLDADGDVEMLDQDTILVLSPPPPPPPPPPAVPVAARKPRARAAAARVATAVPEALESAAAAAPPAPPRLVRKSVRASRRATAGSAASFAEM